MNIKNKLNSCALFSTLFSILLIIGQGYHFGGQSTGVYLPVIQSILGQNSLAGDFNIITQKFYHVNFIWLCALFSKILGLAPTFFTGYFAAGCLLGVAVYRLGKSLFGSIEVTALSALMLILWGSQGMENNTFWFTRSFEAYFLAWPFVLLAVHAFLERKFFSVSIFLGLATIVHIQMGMAAAIVIFPCVIILDVKKAPLEIAKAIILYGVIALGILFEHGSIFATGPSIADKHFLSQAAFRMPQHFVFNLNKFCLFSSIVSGISWFILRGKRLGTEVGELSKHHRVLLVVFSLFLLCILQYLDFYYFKWGPIARLQFLRLSPAIHLFGLMYLAKAVLYFAQSKKIMWQGSAFIIAFIGWPGFFSDEMWLHKEILMVVVFIAAVFFIFSRKKSTAGIFIGLCILLLMKSVWGLGCRNDFFVYDARLQRSNHWVETCRWIGGHTPQESIFITPPYKEYFSFYARRAMIAEFKVNPHIESQVEEWAERLKDLTGYSNFSCTGYDCYPVFKMGYNQLSPASVELISRKYNATFLVTESDTKYPYAMVYQNTTIKVYQLK